MSTTPVDPVPEQTDEVLAEGSFEQQRFAARPARLRPRARRRKDRAAPITPPFEASSTNRAYVQWLEEQSMLHDARQVSRQVAGSHTMWANAYAHPDPRAAGHAIQDVAGRLLVRSFAADGTVLSGHGGIPGTPVRDIPDIGIPSNHMVVPEGVRIRMYGAEGDTILDSLGNQIERQMRWPFRPPDRGCLRARGRHPRARALPAHAGPGHHQQPHHGIHRDVPGRPDHPQRRHLRLDGVPQLPPLLP